MCEIHFESKTQPFTTSELSNLLKKWHGLEELSVDVSIEFLKS
jgi:hypothetical protein